MITQKFLDTLDKNKYYCAHCAEEGIATELKIDKESGLINICEKHKNKKANAYNIFFNFKENDWFQRRANNNKKFYKIKTLEENQQIILDLFPHIKLKEINNLIKENKIVKLESSKNNQNNKKDSSNFIFYVCNLLDEDYIFIRKHKYTSDENKINLYKICDECKKEFKILTLDDICSRTWCYNEICRKSHASKMLKNRKLNISFNEEHKKLFEKYNLNYKNEYTYGKYVFSATKNNLTLEEYLKLLKEENDKINKHKYLLESNGFSYISEISYVNMKNAAKRLNLSIEKYIKLKVEKREYQNKKDKLLIKYGRDPLNWGQILIKAHLAGFNDKDKNDYENMENYLNFQLKIEKQNEKEIENHIKLCKKYNMKYINEYSWRNYKRIANELQLTIEEYFQKIKEEKENKEKRNKMLLKLADDYCYKSNLKGIKAELRFAKQNGFNSGDERKDLENYRNWKIKNNINKHEHIILTEEEFKLFKKIISDVTVLDDCLKERNICGVYCIVIDGYPFYFGESLNIFTRYFSHVKNMIRYPQNFDNIINDILNNIKDPLTGKMRTLSLKVVKELDISNINIKDKKEKKKIKKILKALEKEIINKFNPYSQKCNGTDSIIQNINDREKYEKFKNNYNKELLNEL